MGKIYRKAAIVVMLLTGMSGLWAAGGRFFSLGGGLSADIALTDISATSIFESMYGNFEMSLFPQHDPWNVSLKADIGFLNRDSFGLRTEPYRPSLKMSAIIRWQSDKAFAIGFGGGLWLPGASIEGSRRAALYPMAIIEPSLLFGSVKNRLGPGSFGEIRLSIPVEFRHPTDRDQWYIAIGAALTFYLC